MSGVGSRETGLDSLFASKPIGPGFEPCLGQSAKLAGAPKLLCLSVCLSVSAHLTASLAGLAGCIHLYIIRQTGVAWNDHDNRAWADPTKRVSA